MSNLPSDYLKQKKINYKKSTNVQNKMWEVVILTPHPTEFSGLCQYIIF